MPGPVTVTKYDVSTEEYAMRRSGMLGRGTNVNQLYAIDYDCLPPEARTTIGLVIAGGPFPFPAKDGSAFGNRFGDLPEGEYLEYTVRTPGVNTRGARRIVARKRTGQIFFTACHYERVQATGGTWAERVQAQKDATAAIDAEYRNGFYIVTGMTSDLRDRIVRAIKAVS